MLKLKLQYFGHLMRRVDSLEKTLMLGGIGGRRRRGLEDEMGEWHHQLDGQEFDGQIDPLESEQKATALHEQTSQSLVTCLLLVASFGFQPTTTQVFFRKQFLLPPILSSLKHTQSVFKIF